MLRLATRKAPEATTANSGMSLQLFLTLGRVSNLPTVWTNTLAALVLSGSLTPQPPSWLAVALVLLAMSLMYTGGMFLNDAWDAEIDARERPERPIPSGLIGWRTVRNLAFSQFIAAIGVLWLAWSLLNQENRPDSASEPLWLISAGALVAAIVLYDRYHKGNPLSPWLMAICRVLVYLTTALLFQDRLPLPLLIGAGMLVLYLAGLTALAKQESRRAPAWQMPAALLSVPLIYGVWLATREALAWFPWLSLLVVVFMAVLMVRRGPPDGPRAIGLLIAGICLLDAMLIAPAAPLGLLVATMLGFALTRLLQRRISGT